ncbi:hypothetical protein PJI17_24795 [Mycobacterium kansasii]
MRSAVRPAPAGSRHRPVSTRVPMTRHDVRMPDWPRPPGRFRAGLVWTHRIYSRLG